MPFLENELPLIEANLRTFCKGLDIPGLEDKLCHAFRIEGQSIIVFDIRPHFEDHSKTTEADIAKLRFFRSRSEWRLYWMRADLKWHLYEPFPTDIGYMPLLKVVEEDAYHCFFG